MVVTSRYIINNCFFMCYVALPSILGSERLLLPSMFHLFLKRGGQISVEVAAKRRNKGFRLEIRATYTFYHEKPSKIKTLMQLIRERRWSGSVDVSIVSVFVFIMSCYCNCEVVLA